MVPKLNKTLEERIFEFPLQSWSWKDITDMYTVYGKLLSYYDAINRRIHVPQADINFSDEANTFLFRWHSDIKRIDAHLAAMDREIARRNNLVGVI